MRLYCTKFALTSKTDDFARAERVVTLSQIVRSDCVVKRMWCASHAPFGRVNKTKKFLRADKKKKVFNLKRKNELKGSVKDFIKFIESGKKDEVLKLLFKGQKEGSHKEKYCFPQKNPV